MWVFTESTVPTVRHLPFFFSSQSCGDGNNGLVSFLRKVRWYFGKEENVRSRNFRKGKEKKKDSGNGARNGSQEKGTKHCFYLLVFA